MVVGGGGGIGGRALRRRRWLVALRTRRLVPRLVPSCDRPPWDPMAPLPLLGPSVGEGPGQRNLWRREGSPRRPALPGRLTNDLLETKINVDVDWELLTLSQPKRIRLK